MRGFVIAELPRIPELAKAHFAQGKLSYFEFVRICLLAERDAGAANIVDPEMAATQFLGVRRGPPLTRRPGS
ncbi:TetR/AcrR family transcriptional regulator C-terminal domain-containing protein [Micromonospora sp. NPDC048935]|uniref:TetR/AcrR family transcriptional regulator C-terminal domain-containing protein n=1 Tax=Micromonospora sp. NPDC048935 TaxID=3364262 RepID=UPI0037222396